MDTKLSAKTAEVIQLKTATKTIVEDAESQNLPAENKLDNNDNVGNNDSGDYDADVVVTDKSALRRMNSLDYAGNKNVAEGL